MNPYIQGTGNIFRLDLVYRENRREHSLHQSMYQDPQSISFLTLNFVLIGGVALVIFAYLVMLIRKRWKKNFLHDVDDDKGKK